MHLCMNTCNLHSQYLSPAFLSTLISFSFPSDLPFTPIPLARRIDEIDIVILPRAYSSSSGAEIRRDNIPLMPELLDSDSWLPLLGFSFVLMVRLVYFLS